MTQDEKWIARYNEVKSFIETNERNPSKHDDNERGLYLNWIKHNKKLYNSGEMKPERVEKFKELLALTEVYRRKNQYQWEGWGLRGESLGMRDRKTSTINYSRGLTFNFLTSSLFEVAKDLMALMVQDSRFKIQVSRFRIQGNLWFRVKVNTNCHELTTNYSLIFFLNTNCTNYTNLNGTQNFWSSESRVKSHLNYAESWQKSTKLNHR